MEEFLYQIHGYKSGHQLLHSTVILDRQDQDTIDRLSDISGALRPGEQFAPYLTCYPLPSQRFFVIARTWQDLKSQRAGCVITKSLLIPLSKWTEEKNVSRYFQIVLTATNSIDAGLPSLIYRDTLSNEVSEPIEELVEAIFLENRQPILAFNTFHPETIIIRLYSVLWREMRSTFASCTFALSQRSINGRLFDLLFAPTSVRPKFSDWPGRRLDLAASKPARHRWTTQLARSIFYQSEPRLLSNNIRNLFPKIVDTDEGIIRLTLLWNELLEKAENASSPTSVLGLLDIINSQIEGNIDLYKMVRPYIINSIKNASMKLSIEDTWKFYGALLVKYKKKMMDREMILLVRNHCTNLVNADVLAAIHFINDFSKNSTLKPTVLYASIGDGLALADIFKYENNGIDSKTLVLLLAASKELCKELMSYGSFTIIYTLLNNSSIPLQYQIKLIKNITQFIVEPYHSKLLAIILDDSNEDLYKQVTKIVAKANQFAIPEYNETLVFNANRLELQYFLFDTVAEYKIPNTNSQLLEMLVSSTPYLIERLVIDNPLDDNERIKLLYFALSEVPTNLVKVFQGNKILSQKLFEILKSRGNYVDAFANFVTFADISPVDTIHVLAMLTTEQLSNVNTDCLVHFLLNAIPFTPDNLYVELSRIVENASQVSISELIGGLLNRIESPQQLLTVFSVLNRGGNRINQGLQLSSDLISITIANILNGKYDGLVMSTWMSLIQNIPSQEQKVKNAGYMLRYAYNARDFDPTDVLTFCFPIVYKSYLKGNSFLNYFPFILFADWDKCRTLREDLVERYFNSRWAPLGLFKVALNTEILDDIMSIVFSRKGAKKFVSSAINELVSSDLAKNHPLRQEFNRLFKF